MFGQKRFLSATVSKNMRQTGFVLPAARMNMNKSVHSLLKALFSLSTFLFLESTTCSYFSLSSAHSPLCLLSHCNSEYRHMKEVRTSAVFIVWNAQL